MARAQVEVQFNWIFVMIVGAILLTFFVVVVNKQRESAGVALSADVLIELEKVIAGVAVSEGKTFLIEMPNVPIVYDCDDSCACALKVEGSGAQDIPIRNNPVFAPDGLKGLKVVMWSQPFNSPFRATNFFYMTSPQAKYLIEDVGSGPYIFDELPPTKIIEGGVDQPAFTKELFDPTALDELEDTNNYKIKFILFETDPTTMNLPLFIEVMSDSDVSAVEIIEDLNELKFYQKEGDSFVEVSTTNYIESSSLYGAVFAENIATYECMMNIAFENLNVVSQVYAQRGLLMQEEYSDRTECSIYYDTLYMDNIIDSTKNGFKEMTDVDFSSLRDAIRGLDSQNEGATLFSCAAIY